jgi:signal transduction histidine kinase
LERVDEIKEELIAELEALRRRVAELEELGTEHRRAEQIIQEAREYAESIVATVRESLVVLDTDLRVVTASRSFYQTFEVILKDTEGQLIYELGNGQWDIPQLRKLLEEILPENSTFDGFEVEHDFPTIGRKIMLLNARQIRQIYKEGNRKQLILLAIEDITERKKMEEQLLIEEQLIMADRLASIGELAAGITHELNNPLTSVIGFSQLLLGKDIPDDIREDVKVIYNEAQRAAEVMKNLLIFARRHAPVKQLVNINSIIEKVLTVRAYEQRVENIQVITHLASDLPETMADYFQLQQVFLNIIINAEHFMLEAHQRGTLTITTHRIGSTIRASFTDDGPGIAKENLGHLFDPFFTTKGVGRGTGLGLSICHGIITEHCGRIYAESELGKGATFVVELPIAVETNSEGGSNE